MDSSSSIAAATLLCTEEQEEADASDDVDGAIAIEDADEEMCVGEAVWLFDSWVEPRAVRASELGQSPLLVSS
jgi:hypothetical protein